MSDRHTSKDSLKVRFAPLSLEEAYSLADDAANGAIVVMSGTVRNQTDGKAVIYLEYQAYEPMALEIFQQIAANIRQNWPDTNRVVIHHRTGKLQIGEISVVVAVGCPHRGEAFEACRYAIDTLKHNAPIWKKEHWEDGSSQWVSIGACEQINSNCYKTSDKQKPSKFDPQRWEADLKSLSEQAGKIPILPPEAFTRESIYGNHD